SVPLGLVLATATLTVLHDAGHRRFSRREWPNVLAVQTAIPAGLWVAHWTLKHRVHHRDTQLYPTDEATRSSGLIRLHPGAERRPVHRFQHYYAWLLYGIAWMGEIRSQLTYLRTGEIAGTETPPALKRTQSFVTEKAVCLLVLLPYALVMGVGPLALLLIAAMTVASVTAAVVLVVGHINTGLSPALDAPEGRDEWVTHLVRTSASFGTENRLMRWATGGMTHHLVHHLRASAPRSEFPLLHTTIVADAVATSGSPLVEYPGLPSAVRGHARALRDLGHADQVVAGALATAQPERVLTHT
ncbi:MAG: fatty acid desaturase, partial [Thermoleophilaceae bacterium]|nr:fatty acid desaturase [Thermoleophilaceae bacterium]